MTVLLLLGCMLAYVRCQGCVDPIGYSGVAAKLSSQGNGYEAKGGVEDVYTYKVSICEGLNRGATKCTQLNPVWGCQTLTSGGSDYQKALAGGSGHWTVAAAGPNRLTIAGTGGVLCTQGENSMNISVTCGTSNSNFAFVEQGPPNTPESCIYYFSITSPAACSAPPPPSPAGPGMIAFGPPKPNATAFFAFTSAVACRTWQAAMTAANCTTNGAGCSLASLQVTYPTVCRFPVTVLAGFGYPFYAAVAAPAQAAFLFNKSLVVGTATANVTLGYTKTAACLSDYINLDVQNGMVTEDCGRNPGVITISRLPSLPIATLSNMTALSFETMAFVDATGK